MLFSIINHKKFIVFNRYSDKSKTSKNSRIESLCNNLGLEDRRYKEGNIISEIDKNIDYVEVENKIESMRNKSKNYLKEALKDIM